MKNEYILGMRSFVGSLLFNHRLKAAALASVAPLLASSLFVAAAADTPAPTFRLTAESPQFWKLLDRRAKLTRVAGDFGFTEGPVWDESGFLYVSDESQNKIFRVFLDGRKQEVIALGDPDGNTYDRKHRLIDCASVLRAIIVVTPEGKYTVLADHYEGRKLNSPNDVVIGPDGAIYFTDPTLDLVKGEQQEIPFQGVYRLDDKGGVRLLTKDLTQPNGLAFSPDGKHFYVDDDDSEQLNIRVYDVASDGSLSNGRIFGEEKGAPHEGVPDGMKVDRDGNLFVTGPKGIWVWDAQGHHLGTIEMPEQPANLAWGDNDYRTLYITATTSVYRLRTKTRGFVPYRAHSRMSFSRQFLALGCLLSASVSIFLSVSAHAAAPRGQRDRAAAHADRGFEFARAGKLDSAEAELREAAELDPSDPTVLAALGAVLAQEQKLEESTAFFRRALRISPGDLTVRRYLAANLWQLHLYRDAKDNLQIILKRKPGDQASQLMLGMVSENLGDYATAVDMLAAVPDEVHKQPESVAALARSYYHLGQTENARATLAPLAAHPAGPQAAFLGAQIADEMQDYPTAEKLLASIPSGFPDQLRFQYTLALVEYHAGEFDQSQRILESLIASGNKTAATLNLLGWCHQKQGRSREALQSLEESIALAPAETANYLDLVKILLAQHELPSALRAANRTTDNFPNSAAAFELRGIVQVGMGQFTDAVRSYTQAMQLDPSRPDGILGLAQSQFAAGMTKDAAAHFETGIKRFPRDARFKAQYAAVLLKQSETGDPAAETKAEQLLRSALALDPSLPDVHYQLGNLALKKDSLVEAERQLEQAVKLDARNAPAHFALSRLYRRLGRRPEAAHEMEMYESLKRAESGKDGLTQTDAKSPE